MDAFHKSHRTTFSICDSLGSGQVLCTGIAIASQMLHSRFGMVKLLISHFEWVSIFLLVHETSFLLDMEKFIIFLVKISLM